MNLMPYARTLRKNATDAENKLWLNINRRQLNDYKFRRQQIIDDKYIVDFICFEKRLIIEIDGGQHTEELDKNRTDYLKNNGFNVIRFWNNEILQNIEDVLKVIRLNLGIKD